MKLKRSLRPRYKKRYLLIILAVCLVAGISYYLVQSFKSSKPADTVISREGNLTLTDTPASRRFTNGDQIAGTFNNSADQGLFYTLTDTKSKKLVGSGSIAPDKNGYFSRNLETSSPIEEGTPLTLRIYGQDKQGSTKDDLTFSFTYRAQE